MLCFTEGLFVLHTKDLIRTNRDRVRCYRCQEYDHYANECQYAVASDSEGHDSDNAALQIMATGMELDDTRDIERYRKIQNI